MTATDERTQIGGARNPKVRDWLASLQPALYDLSGCRHGCNGWPCGSEECTFICHEGLPVRV